MRRHCTRILVLLAADKDLRKARHHNGTRLSETGLFLALSQFLQRKLQEGAYLAVYRPEVLRRTVGNLAEHGLRHAEGGL